MAEAKLTQCIYLLVEGVSEERALPVLLAKAGLNLEDLGVVVANYNESGNLLHVLRLLRNTLSHTRPIILTIDNDERGAKIISKCQALYSNSDLYHVFPIPNKAKVKYPSGHVGGSFEEIFSVQHFLSSIFSREIMSDRLISRKAEFESIFDKRMPWFSQVKSFCAKYRDYSFESKKVKLAELLAITCDSVPKSITKLAAIVNEIRQRHPVRHPLDIELPEF
jgi:hypothetical protein